jgi:isochorismate pyruvate lyase
MEKPMKSPEACENLQDVRDACDAIDREIVALLGKRMPYVRTAVRFKRSETDITHPDKMPAFMRQRREWAADEGPRPRLRGAPLPGARGSLVRRSARAMARRQTVMRGRG